MLRISVVAFIVLIYGCKTSYNEYKSVDISNKDLNRSLTEYLKAVKVRQSFSNFVTLDFLVTGQDSVTILLINSHPNLDSTKVYGAYEIGDFKVFFIGDNPGDRYFKILRTYTRSKKTAVKTIKNSNYSEPLLWKLYFVDGSFFGSYKGDSILHPTN